MIKQFLAITGMTFLLFAPLTEIAQAEETKQIKKTEVKIEQGFSMRHLANGFELDKQNKKDWFEIDASKLQGKDLTLSLYFENKENSNLEVYLYTANTFANFSTDNITYKNVINPLNEASLNKTNLIGSTIKNLPKSVVLKPKEKKVVEFIVSVPVFNGEVIGGIIAKNLVDQGGSLRTETEYIKAIHLINGQGSQNNFTIDGFEQNQQMKTIKYGAWINNSNNAIRSEDVVMTLKDGQGKVLNTTTTKDVRIPPNVKIKANFRWPKDVVIQPGTYTVDINKQIFTFEVAKEIVQEIVQPIVKPTIKIEPEVKPKENLINTMKNMDKRVVAKGFGILVFIILIAFLLMYLVRKKSNNKEKDLTSAKALAIIVAKKLIDDEFLGEVEIKGILYSPSNKTFNKKGKIQSAFLGTVAIRINNSVCLVTELNGEKETGTIQELSVKEWNAIKDSYTWY